MKRIARIVPVLALAALVAAPLTGHAAERKAKSEVVMKMGNKVHLFHSSKVNVQKDIAVGDVLPVYRVSVKGQQEKEVGQVKVTGFIGDHYFEAEIVKGQIKPGDVAKKEDSALLVQ